MTTKIFTKTLKVLLVISALCVVMAVDLEYSEITIVNDTTRYRLPHPGIEVDVFNKRHHVKGAYAFTSGERITGDGLLLNFHDKTQFTCHEDIEVLLRYPFKGNSGNIITQVEIYAMLTSLDADAFFIDGGINKMYAKILLTCNRTLDYSYDIFIYGY